MPLSAQELKLRDGLCEISAGKPDGRVTLRVFVDADHPVVHVMGESNSPVTVTAKVESWRTAPQKVPDESAWTLAKGPTPIIQAADVFPKAGPSSVCWYHRNESSLAFEETIRVQSLEPIRGTLRDPLLHRTFGGWLTGPDFKSTDDRTLTTPSSVRSFNLTVAGPCEQTPTAAAWLACAEKVSNQAADAAKALTRTRASWDSFWNRSWVICDAGPSVEVPQNPHPIRIGSDSSGGSRFAGTIGACRVLGNARTPDGSNSEPQITPPSNIEVPDFKHGLTLEAWIKPEDAASGRILDKITVGGSDGFLLDVQPENRIRLIVGSATLMTPSPLSSALWTRSMSSHASRNRPR